MRGRDAANLSAEQGIAMHEAHLCADNLVVLLPDGAYGESTHNTYTRYPIRLLLFYRGLPLRRPPSGLTRVILLIIHTHDF